MYVYMYAKYYIIYRVVVYMQYKRLIIFFYFSSVTDVYTCDIYTEVFSHDSTQFSEAKTTRVLKQFVEHQ